jgi:flagellin-like hook-associated protein FlgL
MDADIGTTTANLSKYTILQQTGISALQQSEQMSQGVLKLLQS